MDQCFGRTNGRQHKSDARKDTMSELFCGGPVLLLGGCSRVRLFEGLPSNEECVDGFGGYLVEGPGMAEAGIVGRRCPRRSAAFRCSYGSVARLCARSLCGDRQQDGPDTACRCSAAVSVLGSGPGSGLPKGFCTRFRKNAKGTHGGSEVVAKGSAAGLTITDPIFNRMELS